MKLPFRLQNQLKHLQLLRLHLRNLPKKRNNFKKYITKNASLTTLAFFLRKNVSYNGLA
jgi:hypothetical protein